MLRLVFTALMVFIVAQINAQQSTDLATELLSSKFADRFEPSDLQGWIHHRSINNRESGYTYHYYQQSESGVPIHNAMMTIVTSPEGGVIHVADRFIAGKTRLSKKSTAGTNPEQALKSAARHLGVNAGDVSVMEVGSAPLMEGIAEAEDLALEPIPFQLVYQNLDDQQLALCWEFVIRMKDHQNWWQIRVDAATGAVLDKNNWIVNCGASHLSDGEHSASCLTEVPGRNPLLRAADATPEATPAPLMANSYNVFPEPLESPYDGSRSIISLPWNNNLTASPFGWHDTNGSAGAEYTITRGNNVWAQEDRNGNNGTGFSPDGGAALDFDFPLDLTQQPVTYQEAAITNLFYWNNLCHDIFYNYGFDEQSGNFQANNYGNPGFGGDEVLADAQDGSGTNNANFGTPPDGQRPRMQMFEWTFAAVPSFTANGISYTAITASFGPNTGVYSGELVLANDGSGEPTLACNALVNPPDYNGKVVLIDRGTCTFVEKVLNAQAEGAIAVIVAQNTGDAPFSMGGAEPAITIPSVMVSQADGQALKDAMNNGTVNVNIDLPASVNRDSDLDNGVIVHEYGHGVSIRLTGGAGNVSCLFNNEQMGEGWSDYLALILTMKPGDAATDARGIGNYSLGDGPNGVGIRPFPYSFDLGVNPVTYNDISGLSIPHGVGSVWCSMLWDMTWLLVDQHGWDPDIYNGTGGNNIALQLVIEGLKLQPCEPGFVDGRDAILLADQLLYGGQHQCLIWEAFARRGLGAGASQGSSNNVGDGIEDYSTPGSCDILISKTSAGEMEAGSTMTVTLEVTNNTGGQATNVTINDAIPAEVSYVDGSASCAVTVNGNDLTFNLGSLNSGETVTCTYSVEAPLDPFSVFQINDDVEGGQADFVVETGSGAFQWSLNGTRFNSPSTSWFAPDPGTISDQYLVLENISDVNPSTFLSFWHFFNTETDWDGCVMEVSTNGGGSWSDLAPSITQNGYNSTINTNPDSPISGRQAWSGSSGGWIQTIIDLSSYAGQTISIRWRMASDAFVSGEGWYVDDVFLGDVLVDFTNTACVDSDQTAPFCASQYTFITEQSCVPQSWYEDADGDGFGNAEVTTSACLAPVGFVSDNTDCDDTREDVYPGAPGTAEGIDNNCNGDIDAAECAPQMWYEDADGDGFGNAEVATSACLAPVGFVSDNTDCDDTREDVYPGAPGTAEGIDNNCNGDIDAAECAPQMWYEDADGDGFGNAEVATSACLAPVGFVSDNTDCDDTREDVYPGAPGTAEGIDNNCNGDIDAAECAPQMWYEDADGDGFGNAEVATSACLAPVGFVSDNTDCDDTREDVYPGAPGTAEGIDNNCNGLVEATEAVPVCLGDFNNDLFINVSDLLILLSDFGCSGNCIADLNESGDVNSSDMLVFLSLFDTTCE